MGVLTSKTTTDVCWESERALLRVTMVEGGVQPGLRVEVGVDVLLVDIDPIALHDFAEDVLKAYDRQAK